MGSTEALERIVNRYEPKMSKIRDFLVKRELYEAFMTQVVSAADHLATICDDGYVIPDLYLFYERLCLSRSIHRRESWNNAYFPYFSPRLAKDFFRMPTPINRHAQLHRELVHRYAPKILWTRVNDGQLLPFQTTGSAARTLRIADRKWRWLRQWRRNRSKSSQQMAGRKSVEELQAYRLFGPLRASVNDILSSAGDISNVLFGNTAVDRLFDDCHII